MVKFANLHERKALPDPGFGLIFRIYWELMLVIWDLL